MARKRSTAEASMGHLRTIEIERGRGLAVLEACRKLGLTEHTDDRWKHEDGGVRVEQAKWLKSLEQEHARLTRLVAARSLDTSLWKEVAAGTCSARPDAEKQSAGCKRCSRCLNAGRVAWWGNAGPRSRMCRCAPMRKRPCRRGLSHWRGSMVAMGIGGSRPCSRKKGGG